MPTPTHAATAMAAAVKAGTSTGDPVVTADLVEVLDIYDPDGSGVSYVREP